MLRDRFFTASTALFLVLAFSVCLASAAGAVPPLLSYSGTLTDTAGNPVVDGAYEVQLAIYEVPTGGAPLWTETWGPSTVPITTVQGTFSVLLGSHVPIPEGLFAAHGDAYLGVRVGADAEMLPRQRIASVAYAMRSGDGVPPGAIILWSGAIDAVPQGWALCDGVERTLANGARVTPPDLRDRFVVGAGSIYPIGPGARTGSEYTVSLSHSHSVTAESLATSRDGDHQHSINLNTGNTSQNSVGVDQDGNAPWVSADHYHNLTGSTQGDAKHSHAVNAHSHGGATGSAGATALDNRPPYFALAYIMKL